MSKRKRKERRQRQQANALKKGDLGTLRAIADRNPDAGANALIAAFDQSALDPTDPDVIQLAHSALDSLREGQRHDKVIRLVQAFPNPTTYLRLCRALSCIAIGDDKTAAADAADERVARFVSPILATLHGNAIPRTPSKAPRAVRSTVALCRAVAASRKGQRSQARKYQSAINASFAKAMCVDALELVIDLNRKQHPMKAFALVRRLVKEPIVRTSPAIRRTIGMMLAERYPKIVLRGDLPDLALDAEQAGAVAMRATLADSSLDSERSRVSYLISTLGAAAFPTEHRSAAHLYEGFALATSQPGKAKMAFDAAVASNADLAEALRGRALVDIARDNPCEAARTLMRLVKVLLHEPGGEAVAIQAARACGSTAAAGGERKLGMEAVGVARSTAERAGLLTDALRGDLLMQEASLAPAQRVADLLDQASALIPDHPNLWSMRIDFAHERGDTKEAERLILEAGDRRISREYTALAQQLRAKRGESWTPVPGECSVGQLAAELNHRLAKERRGSTAGLDDLLRCREALSPVQQTAFDMAHYLTLSASGQDNAADLVLTNAISSGIDDVTRDAWLLLAADYGPNDALIPKLVERALRNPEDSFAHAAVEMLAFSGADFAMQLISRLSPHLTHSRTKALQKCLSANLHSDQDDALLLRLKTFEAELLPEYSLRAVLEGEDPVHREPARGVARQDPLLQTILDAMGAPPGILDEATEAQLQAARALAVQLLATSSPGRQQRILRRLQDVLEEVEDGPFFL